MVMVKRRDVSRGALALGALGLLPGGSGVARAQPKKGGTLGYATVSGLGTLDPQRIEVLKKRLDVFLGELIDRLAVLGGLLDDAILNIGQVHHLGDAVPLLQEDPPQKVLEEEGAEVADV